MTVPGTMGKILWVDLTNGELRVEVLEDEIYLKYLGGYGIGAHYLYKHQKPKVDPLGPDNHLGFFTGVLTGTPGISTNRYAVVAKSPKTGTWGDANSGGDFGITMKNAGFDGVIFHGISEKPVYLLLKDGKAKLLPADDWWGKNSLFIEEETKKLYGPKTSATCIGPAGERQSLLSCIINNRGRAAGRSGLGAVMGSKGLKAIVCVGDEKITMAEPDNMKKYNAEQRKKIRDHGMVQVLSQYGTAGFTAGACELGDTPIKNWGGVPDDFPTASKISDDAVLKIQNKKYACWRCPIACGGETDVSEGEMQSKGHKPEYETLGAFGTMCLNDCLASINLCNAICNEYGLDTISTGCTIAFAIECYENGILTKDDTGGIELKWGNGKAIADVTMQIAQGTGFGGQVLADGMKVAAERIGKGAEEYAIHIQGEEIPMHDPRFSPGLATSYKMDATPGRHTQLGAWAFEVGMSPPGLIPKEFDKYEYSGKGETHRIISNNFHVANAAGQCMFAWIPLEPQVMVKSLTYTTGHEYTLEELDEIGGRIAALRIAFNLREGIKNIDLHVPGRMLGNPPLKAGPLKGVTVDMDTQVQDYIKAIGWHTETGVPTKETLESLGLEQVAADLYNP